MTGLVLTAFALLVQQSPPTLPPGIILRDIRQGPMPAENRTLSMPHRNADPLTYADLTVKALRVDGGTLHVLVANQGGRSAAGPIRVRARVEAGGALAEAEGGRLSRLAAGKSRWVPVRDFAWKVAAASGGIGPALDSASFVSASVSQGAGRPAALDRSGQAQDDQGRELNTGNNGLRLAGPAIPRGAPERLGEP